MQKNPNFHNTYSKFRMVNDKVYYAMSDITKLRKQDIELLKQKAMHNNPKKIRLCTHREVNDSVHEMFIIFGKGTYVRPHKHPGKSVSYHIIDGFIDVVFFNEAGGLVDFMQMGGYRSNHIFYSRLSKPHYYMPIIKSRFAVFHEIINGPFKNDTVFPGWAPAEDNKSKVQKFMEGLEKRISGFLSKKPV